MLPETIIEKIRVKLGKDRLYTSDCREIAEQMSAVNPQQRISESTVKRLLGFIGVDSPDRNRVHRTFTMDIIARYLGYTSYTELLKEIEEDNYSSDFHTVDEIISANLEVGTQIQLQYMPSRLIIMTYLGNNEYLINKAQNSKLRKGDHVKITILVLGHELIASKVVRNGSDLGSYVAAKDGGLTQLEIIN